MNSFRSLLPPLLAMLMISSACGESSTEIERSLGPLLRRQLATGPTINEMLFAAPEDEEEEEEEEREEFEQWQMPNLGGLALCSDVPLVVGTRGERPTGTLDLDTELLTVLSDYGSKNRSVFGGLWLDGDSAGGLLVAFTEDADGHREQIMSSLGGESWDAPFSVVEVQHREADLNSTKRAVDRLNSQAVVSASVDLTRNRVAVSLLDPVEAELEELSAAIDLQRLCADVTMGPAIPEGPLEVLPQGGGGSLLSCDEVPFPASALDARIPVSAVDHPAIPVLNGFIDGDPEWIVLDLSETQGLFAKYDGEVQVSALATTVGATWEISGWTFGCDMKIGLPAGLGAVEIFTNPEAPAALEDRVLNLLVSEVACAGGRSMGKRLLAPEVIETDDQVILAFAAVKQNVEFLDCPSNPVTKVRVTLSGPLAGRTVLDGMYLPARPVGEPWFVD